MAAAPGPMPVSTPRKINYPSWGECPSPCTVDSATGSPYVKPCALCKPTVRQSLASLHAVSLGGAQPPVWLCRMASRLGAGMHAAEEEPAYSFCTNRPGRAMC